VTLLMEELVTPIDEYEDDDVVIDDDLGFDDYEDDDDIYDDDEDIADGEDEDAA